MLLAVANRPIDTGSTYTVGADVSRFQRSSVPRGSGPVTAATAPDGAGTERHPGRAVRGQRSGRPRRAGQQCHGRSGGSKLR